MLLGYLEGMDKGFFQKNFGGGFAFGDDFLSPLGQSQMRGESHREQSQMRGTCQKNKIIP